MRRRECRSPHHVHLGAGEPVWLVLVDPDGVWAAGAPELEVELL